MATEVRQSACPLDCPDSCSLEMKIEDGRLVKIDGDRRNAYTQGFICSKVRHLPEHLYGSTRLLYPARRVNGKGEAGRFERISWDEALDLVARKLTEARERHGGESILPYCYGGSNGMLTQDTTDARLFYRLGASRLLRTVCAAPTGAAAKGLYGKMSGVALPDYVHSNLIVVWGVNPSATGIHFIPYVQEAQKRGARLVVVDPRATPLAKQADLHLTPRPGTDVALALAVVRWLFATGSANLGFLRAHTVGWETLRVRAERWTLAAAAETTGVPAADIETLATWYAESHPAAIRCGWGMERNRNGGSAVAAVLALPAVAGKFGVRGGGYTLSNSGAWSFDREAIVNATEPRTRVVNMNQIGRALDAAATPPVKVLFVYNSNLAVTSPNAALIDRGLRRDDLFTVVFEQAWTDTAQLADVVLPATTFPEHHELSRGYGPFVLHRAAPVVDAAGEARPNYEVFDALVRRLGLAEEGDVSSPEALGRAILGADLDRRLGAAVLTEHPAGTQPVQFVDVFPNTPDQKVHLVPADLDREAPLGLYAFRPEPEESDRFPIALISPATNRTISSYLGELRKGRVAIEVAPADAAARGIRDGDRVRVWNDLGEVITAARVTPDQRAGVACLPKGLWSHNTENGRTATDLAPDTLTDLGAGACFNDARVEIARL
jgi:anaerobic selenocysteine-containing dehydrogenase